jgi:hypothetical protein
MMNRLRALSYLGIAVVAASAACETEDASMAVVDNGYPAASSGGPAAQTVVYRAWWVATYFPEPVAPAGTSIEQRSIPASDFAYAVLAPGWDPASATPPAQLVVVKSKAPLSLTRGDTLQIVINDQTFDGSCAAQQPLSQEDADFITQRIFPGELAGVTYDAKTCTMTPIPTGDAGTD